MTLEMEKLRRRCEILEAIVAGGTAQDYAARLGVSISQFYKELKKHGIAYDAYHDPRLDRDIESIVRLGAGGFGSAEIAAVLQRSRQWVSVTAKKHKIKLPHGRAVYVPARRELLAIVSVHTLTTSARALGVSIATLCAWLKAADIDKQARIDFAAEFLAGDAPEDTAPEVAPPPLPVTRQTYGRVKKMGCSPAAVARYEARRDAR